MLNGKFFTGLPPKMMDRGVDHNRNRLESHLFWPDDTQVDTAIESRIKRRNSVQLASAERPLYERQNSAFDNDVDTKKRFSKEFSQSSIQFYDNLNENRGNSRRQTLRHSHINKKMEIAEKPTNTKLELLDNVINEAYTAAKKKQAYASKIEFYDYANDTEGLQNNCNNSRKPKMDMNDKREMELNSKNSPKLQVKRNARSLSEEKDLRKMNNRKVMAKELITDGKNTWQDRKSAEQRVNVSPKRSLEETSNNLKQRYIREREPDESRQSDYGRDPEQSKLYKSSRISQRAYDNFDDNLSYRSRREEPKRLVRNNTRGCYGSSDERDCIHEYQDDEELRNRMGDMRLKSPSSRKEYNTREEYYDDDIQHYYDRNETPTKSGYCHQRFNYNNTNREISDDNLVDKNCYSGSKRFDNNSSSIKKIYNKIQNDPTPASPSHSDAESPSVSAVKSQKHLRSSLSFNNGEIIGENDVIASPTSLQLPTQRRNARSSATQRVSVGLPD